MFSIKCLQDRKEYNGETDEEYIIKPRENRKNSTKPENQAIKKIQVFEIKNMNVKQYEYGKK